MFKAIVLRKIVYGRPVYVYGAKRIYMLIQYNSSWKGALRDATSQNVTFHELWKTR